MPVVTIEPNKLDTVPFETEERESVDFTITNHGLIRADNLRFYLPTGHPTLQFQSVNIMTIIEIIFLSLANLRLPLVSHLIIFSGENRYSPILCVIVLLYL